MPPDIMSSQFIPYSETQNTFLTGYYPFGPGMANILSSEPVSSNSAGKFIILRHMAQFAKVWLRRCLHFLQNVSENLMKMALVGIARRALPILEKMACLRERGELKRDETEEKIWKGHCLGCHSLNSCENYILEETENLAIDGWLGDDTEQLSVCSRSLRVSDMLVEEGISELCLISPTIFFDFGNYCKDSSGEDMGYEDTKSPGKPAPHWLENNNHPKIFTKALDFYMDLEENVNCFNHYRKLHFDKGLGQILETTMVSQALEKSLQSDWHSVIFEKQSLTYPADSSKSKEQPEMSKEDGKKEGSRNLESPTISNNFKSPLVLSLFYSPLEEEEEEDDEGDNEDWWSEGETEESSQAKTYSNGRDSGKVQNCLEVDDDDSIHQDVLENLCGSLSMNNDPFHPLCFSKPFQALTDHTAASLKPKSHKESVTSFYSPQTNSKPEELCHLPKQSWSKEDQRAAGNQQAHNCLHPSSQNNVASIPTEIPLVLQQEIHVKKQVRFSPVVTVHPLVVWGFASRAARRGPWEEMARDRCRFRRRIAEMAPILEPCLAEECRAKAWMRIQGVSRSPLEKAGGPMPVVQICQKGGARSPESEMEEKKVDSGMRS